MTADSVIVGFEARGALHARAPCGLADQRGRCATAPTVAVGLQRDPLKLVAGVRFELTTFGL